MLTLIACLLFIIVLAIPAARAILGVLLFLVLWLLFVGGVLMALKAYV